MYQLKSCVWEITLACPFSCKYCGSSAGGAREKELTTQECLDVARQLAQLGCRRVSLIGGEVFMRADWDLIVRELTRSGVRVGIVTNGFLFTEALLERMKRVHLELVGVSVDGLPAVHDKYRQKGSFARARHAAFLLAESGIPVSVISTLHRENAEKLKELYEELVGWPVYAWQLQACSPMGNASKKAMDYRFDVRAVIRFVQDHMHEAPFRIGIADNIGYFTDQDGCLRGELVGSSCFHGCRAGLTSIGIDSEGNVRGCESMYDERFIEGSLRSRTLREIWEDPEAFRYNRAFEKELLTGACSRCEAGAYCAGGCRSYNFFVHGRLYEAPFCAHSMEQAESEEEKGKGFERAEYDRMR